MYASSKHLQGEGRTRESNRLVERAAVLYRQAAEAGFSEAMNSLAILLEDGRATGRGEPDLTEAASWYYEACAFHGHSNAVVNLCILLASGGLLEERIPKRVGQSSRTVTVTHAELRALLEEWLMAVAGLAKGSAVGVMRGKSVGSYGGGAEFVGAVEMALRSLDVVYCSRKEEEEENDNDSVYSDDKDNINGINKFNTPASPGSVTSIDENGNNRAQRLMLEQLEGKTSVTH